LWCCYNLFGVDMFSQSLIAKQHNTC